MCDYGYLRLFPFFRVGKHKFQPLLRYKNHDGKGGVFDYLFNVGLV